MTQITRPRVQEPQSNEQKQHEKYD